MPISFSFINEAYHQDITIICMETYKIIEDSNDDN